MQSEEKIHPIKMLDAFDRVRSYVVQLGSILAAYGLAASNHFEARDIWSAGAPLFAATRFYEDAGGATGVVQAYVDRQLSYPNKQRFVVRVKVSYARSTPRPLHHRLLDYMNQPGLDSRIGSETFSIDLPGGLGKDVTHLYPQLYAHTSGT